MTRVERSYHGDGEMRADEVKIGLSIYEKSVKMATATTYVLLRRNSCLHAVFVKCWPPLYCTVYSTTRLT